jgi:alpha-L-rhamnosidase
MPQPWRAQWISVPDTPPHDFGVYHFRRTLNLASKPSSFRIRVSADNRYQLFVNGSRIGLGPARGDLDHWRYETYDIAPMLHAGKNVLASVVWNAGPDAPMAQVTNETGFLVSGETESERAADTGKGWKCIQDRAYAPERATPEMVWDYYAAGPGEHLEASRYPWGWEQPEYNDASWKEPRLGSFGGPRDLPMNHSRWMLVPRSVPMAEMKPERLARLRLSNGVTVPAGFPAEPKPLIIPANTTAILLLDNDHLTTGYPELVVSGGAGALVKIAYAEALYLPGPDHRRENRNEVQGREFHGYQDVYLPDGGAKRMFRPLWWRTYRYIQLTVTTRSAPLTIEDLRGVYTGYPFVRKARFEGGPAELQNILDVGWRTARLCAHETYMDCPYWEQLQYVGDTRIQAMVSLYTTGDARLMRNAIAQIDASRTAEGATYSRAPSRLQQYIPPFSLWWIGMVHDYWMYQDDPVFVRGMLPGVRAVLAFFARHQKENGSLGRMPWWNFLDWSAQFKNGVPPSGSDGSSAPFDLQLLLAYQWAAQVESALGSKTLAAEYDTAAAELRGAIQDLYWDSARRFYADTPHGASFSQHTQALAILAGVVQGREARDLIDRTIADPSLVQCTIYFRYYLHRALALTGSGDRYLDMLGEWRRQLSLGLTTWAESPDPSRSDCHAWGASPNIEMFRTVLGIDSAAPGFRRVLIHPALGKLTQASGTMPHPRGDISVGYLVRGGKLEAEITLPHGVGGEFVWNEERRPLNPGKSRLVLGLP